MNYRTVRLYAMSKDELVKINQEEAASRFYISDIERNIRMNLFPSYKVPMNGDSLSETNAKYIADVTERLNEHGFRTGRAFCHYSLFSVCIFKGGCHGRCCFTAVHYAAPAAAPDRAVDLGHMGGCGRFSRKFCSGEPILCSLCRCWLWVPQSAFPF